MNLRGEACFLGLLLALLVLVQSVGLTRPFLRQHESVGTEIGKHARNHLKFGLSTTYGLKLDVSGPSLAPYPEPRRYFYSNHPPLPALAVAGVFAAFGVSEAAFRGLLILVSIGAVLLFRRVAARVVPAPYDRASTAIFAFLPAFAYYSIVTALQVMMLTATLAALLFYLRWTEGRRRSDYAGILASIALACSCAWAGYYVALVLLAAHVRSSRPGTRAVAALLGWNVLLFLLYLAHLWIASPPDLDPIRKLFSAAADRSAGPGRPLPAYVLGELRELGLMMTLPALGLALAWALVLRRGRRAPQDRLCLALPLLGLDEIVFPKLASSHEYFSYPLVLFTALGAGLALDAIAARLRGRRPALAAPAALACLALVFAQCAWVLQRRLTREGAYEFYYRLGLALREGVRPDARVLVLTDNLPFYTPFYGDVHAVWYDARRRELVPENSGGRTPDVDERDVLDRLDDFDAVVTAEKDAAVAAVGALRGLDDGALEAFGVETRRGPRRELLERRCGPPRAVGGFLFWTPK